MLKMPGFDKCRFVEIARDDLDEFTCGICLEVFDNPVFSPCCQQTYCKECITEWLGKQNTCPNDRKELTVQDLIPPPRLLTNLLNKFKIQCDFHHNGCQSVIQLIDLSKHREYCDYNPNKLCDNCGLNIGCEHNCVENLKVKNDSICDEIKRLFKENRDLKTENENLKRLQITQVNKDDKTVKVVNSRMNNQMQEYALVISNEAHDKFRNLPEGKMSTFIRNEFEKKYKSQWNCMVNSSINWGTSIHHFDNHYIYLKIGLFHYVIWESSK